MSTREQEEGYSIDAQLNRLQEYCRRKGLEVLKSFTIIESSTNGDRKHFMEMIAFAKQQRTRIAIVADKVDRIQRSFKETPLLDDLVNRGKIELHFHVENCIIHQNSTSMERLMWNMSVMMAQSYVDSLRDNVNRSKSQKLKKGECIGLAPIGYLNTRDERGRADVIVDEARAALVTRIYETYSTGSHTLGEMMEFAQEWGLTNSKRLKKLVNKSQMYKILTNPFYYGVMKIKKNGEEHPHRYPPLISKALFDRCQEVRLGWEKKPFKYAGIDFVFRGILTCATTGKTISAERHSKTYQHGGRDEWIYLSSWNPDDPKKKVWVREEQVLEQVEAALETLAIKNEKLLQNITSHIFQTNESKKAFHIKQTAVLKKEHTEIEEKLDKLLDLMMEKVISKEEFEAKKRRLKDRQYEIDDLIRSYDEADDAFTNRLIDLLNLSAGALDRFRGSNFAEKRDLLNFVFLNLKLKGKKLEYSMRFPFSEFAKCDDIVKWSE
ncbi:MAG: recombinase family protein [Pseudomonadota bacterium]|nr:recombinase family protein [Pseudomonadota bacterium]